MEPASPTGQKAKMLQDNSNAARESRASMKMYIRCLENRVKQMEKQIAALTDELRHIYGIDGQLTIVPP
ncbi:hypothetical protein RvY_16057 [Ramazzottius varieornatus]|uniref:BZIP domain-containing protein n=1 Tax=Ramazzottius varieornatus TaxID=947166 RepID=A0A1D1VX38_RAMVA|nr:hypothetical protein RvY_16057 [Ramazzottius varieornatus]